MKPNLLHMDKQNGSAMVIALIIMALLTIIGYSLNDTIIVFDRIRENLRKYHKEPMATILNKSINETLSRTILTSLTTLVVVIALFVLGGGIIHDFAFALLVGVTTVSMFAMHGAIYLIMKTGDELQARIERVYTLLDLRRGRAYLEVAFSLDVVLGQACADGEHSQAREHNMCCDGPMLWSRRRRHGGVR